MSGILLVEVPVAQLAVGSDPAPAVLVATQQVATLVAAAEQGPSGPPGPPGAAQAYVFTQPTPSPLWTVNHNFGVRPLITVLSAGGIEVDAEIIHVSPNQAQISFTQPFAGSARCI